MTRRRTPAAFAIAIVAAYDSRGMDPSAALAGAGLSRDELRMEGRITADQFECLSDRAMRELDDEALGWFSRRLPWGSYGMLCRASLPSANLGIAIARWCRHHALLTDSIKLHLEKADKTALLYVEEVIDLGFLREFCLVSILKNVHGIACWLADTRIPLTEVSFPFVTPAHAEVYGHMFDGAVSFGKARTEMRFSGAYLDLPVLRDDAMLRQVLRRPLPIMVRKYRRDRLLGQQALRILDANPDIGLTGVAEMLNLSVRSLSRHLRQEETSFQLLKDVSRRRRAERLLMSTKWSVKRIARECGFEAEESFVRAFKAWTGQTPRAFSCKCQKVHRTPQ
ncbi:MAG TPA: AraC family transcriptional regulator [Pseudolabrys sp.]|nr:AraC family transcriptional regulator [Pseudolabrys sp.]